jgi:dTDP-4-dehydrorhamnose 3,5-epimerase-like enzyme
MPSNDAAPIGGCRFIELPKIADSRGALSFIEGGNHLPFDIARVFYMYELPPGSRRGAHAHYAASVAVFMLSGAADVLLDDGTHRQTLVLDRPQRGLLIAPRVWHELENFAANSVCLVLTSHRYDEADYMRDYQEFRREVTR